MTSRRGSDRRQPLRVPRLLTTDGPEEHRLDILGDGTHPARSDAAVVDIAHGRDLRGGAAHEGLVRAVEVVAREAPLLDGDPLVLGDSQDTVARDPLEDAAGDRRGEERA